MGLSKPHHGAISMAQFAHEAMHTGTLQVFALESLGNDKRVTYFVARSRDALLQTIFNEGIDVDTNTLREIDSQKMGLEEEAEVAINYALEEMSFDPDTDVIPAFVSEAMAFQKAA